MTTNRSLPTTGNLEPLPPVYCVNRRTFAYDGNFVLAALDIRTYLEEISDYLGDRFASQANCDAILTIKYFLGQLAGYSHKFQNIPPWVLVSGMTAKELNRPLIEDIDSLLSFVYDSIDKAIANYCCIGGDYKS